MANNNQNLNQPSHATEMVYKGTNGVINLLHN